MKSSSKCTICLTVVVLLSISVSLCLASNTGFSEDWRYNPATGHWYKLTEDYGNWAETEAEAVALGGHLVTINDSQENNWLAATFGNTFLQGWPEGYDTHNIVWIGLDYVSGDHTDPSSWIWVTGEAVTFWPGLAGINQNGDHMYLHCARHPDSPTWNCNPVHNTTPDMYPRGVIEVEECCLVYQTVDFSEHHNKRLQLELYPGFPEGELNCSGISFSIPVGGNNYWSSRWASGLTSAEVSIDIDVGVSDVRQVHTMINTAWGQPGPEIYTTLEFFGSDGAYFRKDLIGNVDIRDHANNTWANDIQSQAINCFSEIPDGTERRLDKQLIKLPVEFHSQTLDMMRMTDRGGERFHRAFLVGLTVGVCEFQVQSVFVDIKPGSCPNPLNIKSKGKLPVAVLGSEDFDVMTIDPATILLTGEGQAGGVAPIRWDYEDVATPFESEGCGCHDLNGDGYLDLTLKFSTQELVQMLRPEEQEPVTLNVEVLYSEDFEDGIHPVRWGVVTSGDGIFETVTADGNTVLHVSSPRCDDAYGGLLAKYAPRFDFTSKDYAVEFRYMLAGSKNFWIDMFNDHQASLFTGWGTGLVWRPAPLMLTHLTPGQWYDIRLDVLPSAQRYDIFLDSEYLATADKLFFSWAKPKPGPFPDQDLSYFFFLGIFDPPQRPGDNYVFAHYGEAYYDDIIITGAKDTIVPLMLTGNLNEENDSTPIEGQDCIRILRPPVGDMNNDLRVNWNDFSVFSSHWNKKGCKAPKWCAGADLSRSGKVNWEDFAIFANHWLECTAPECD